MMLSGRALFEKCVKLNKDMPEDAYIAAMNVDEPGWLADLVTSTLHLPLPQRQEVLNIIDPVARLQKVNIILAKELDVLELEHKIHSQVQQEVDKTQRDYFLREQMKIIQKELGETDPQFREVSRLREQIQTIGMPQEVTKKADEELNRLSAMPAASPEVSVIRPYLDWLVNLPWAKETEDNLNIKRAAVVLDENHYGLPKVKERILAGRWWLLLTRVSGMGLTCTAM